MTTKKSTNELSAQEIVTGLCNDLEKLSDIMNHSFSFISSDIKTHLQINIARYMIRCAEKAIKELHKEEMISQYPENEREDFVMYLDELSVIVEGYKRSLNQTANYFWLLKAINLM